LSDTHIGEPRLGPGPARQIPEEEEKEDEVIDADKEADKQRDLKDLSDYVSGTSNKQGFSNWSTKIAEALERLGIDKAEVAAIKLTVKNRKNKVAAIVQRISPSDRIPLPPRQPQAPSREPKCAPGDRRSMCSQPSSQPVIIPGREVDRSLGIPRNVPRNVPTTGKTPQGRTIINTSSYQEYFRLKRENERNPNVLVQAPFMGNQSASGAFSGSTSEREIAGARNFSSESADLSSGSLGSVPKFTSNRRN